MCFIVHTHTKMPGRMMRQNIFTECLRLWRKVPSLGLKNLKRGREIEIISEQNYKILNFSVEWVVHPNYKISYWFPYPMSSPMTWICASNAQTLVCARETKPMVGLMSCLVHRVRKPKWHFVIWVNQPFK